MKRYGDIIKIASIFIGSVLGAGFAGGQELLSFFICYGRTSLLGAAIAGILFILVGVLILRRAKSLSVYLYSDYLKTIFSEKTSSFITIITELFLFFTFSIMISGSGALLNQFFSVSTFGGCLISSLICFIVLRKDTSAVGIACSILSPIMLSGIIFVLMNSYSKCSTADFYIFENKNGWCLSTLIYVSYNILTACPTLIAASSLAKDKKRATLGGVLGGFLLFLLLSCACFVLSHIPSGFLVGEMPLLNLAKDAGRFSYYFYFFVLYAAILTTSLSVGLPIAKKLNNIFFYQSGSALFLCTLALPLSFIRFSTLMKFCYTFFGYLGLILIGGIIFSSIKSSKTKINVVKRRK